MPGGEVVVPVSALNRAIGSMLERSFPLVWVAGEVSNFTRAASGHWYFSIKDAQAQMRCVMFRGRAQYAEFTPKEGDRIEVRALVTMYEPRGELQLNVEAVRRTGQGRLYEAFLRLKAQLEAEGLFAAERKRALPSHPRAIGIVTSLQAAALRDVLTTLSRRAPHIPVIVYPAPVQGVGASAKLAAMVDAVSARREVDVLIVCRGGGSIEDLWAFNEEVLARAIAESAVPVVSGVVARILRSDGDVEDVIEETFWQAWRQADRFVEGRGSVQTWLLTIARSRALDRLRAAKRRREESLDEPGALDAVSAAPDDLPPSSASDPSLGVERAERRRLVLAALADLPGEQRQALELGYFGGLSQTEIAEQTGQPLGTVKTRMRLAMQKLRERLAVLREDTR